MNLEVESIRKEEVRENMQRMKLGKAVGPDDIPVEVWKCLGESALKFLTKLYNRRMESERMPEWRDSVLIQNFKNKCDVQSCSNYRGIKLISHTMKLWERIIDRRLSRDLTFSNQQYGFMPGKSTTVALFALRVLLEKYREGQKELHCVFVVLDKAYDKVPRDEVWYCMRKSGLAEKYVRILQDMYYGSTTAVRCAVGVTEGFEVKVGLHQGSALSPCLLAMVMDRMTDEIREEAPWTMMFADDIVICSESKERKDTWFYIALYPVRWTAQSALHFPPLADLFIPTPFSASLGSILAMQQLRNDYSLTFPPLSIARYSFIQLSRLRRREVKENTQTSKR